MYDKRPDCKTIGSFLMRSWRTGSLTRLLSVFFWNEVHLFTRPETEKEFRISPQLRENRLDVVSMDWDKKIYYTEMQGRDTGNLRKRSRLYQAQLDVPLLEPGTVDFNLLNDSCFILIAPFDIFGKSLYRYTFEGKLHYRINGCGGASFK